MTNPTEHPRRTLNRLHEAASHAFASIRARVKEVWERHLELMDEEPAYRAQLVAGATAILTVLRLPRSATAAILAALGLHAAAYGNAPAPNIPAPMAGFDAGWEGYRY